jgi:excisionase family DNA binding protein
MVQTPRFLTIPDVAEILNTSSAQVRALLFSGDLRGIKIGGRGQWRVEVSELEAYIQRQYQVTEELTRPGALPRAALDETAGPGD